MREFTDHDIYALKVTGCVFLIFLVLALVVDYLGIKRGRGAGARRPIKIYSRGRSISTPTRSSSPVRSFSSVRIGNSTRC